MSYLDAHREEDWEPAAGLNMSADGHYSHSHNSDATGKSFGDENGMAARTGMSQAAEETHQARIQSIKSAATREKIVLLDRIEQLSVALQQQSREAAARGEQLDEYHKVFGTLGDFSSRQVAQREEILSLRGSVRQWQSKEEAAQQEVRRLKQLVDSIRRGQRHESAEARLGDLEKRIAAAHVDRASVEQELRDLSELERVRATHTGLATKKAGRALQDDADLADWQIRGKRADLEHQLKQCESNAASLERAAASLRAVAQSERWDSIGAQNRKCPGCGDPQWASPFCPKTGNRHMGFAAESGGAAASSPRASSPRSPAATTPAGPSRPDATNVDGSPASAGQPEDDPEPTFVPPTAEELKARIEGALRANEWSKMVQVGTFEVTYRNEATNEVVHSLGDYFVEQSKAEFRTRHDDWEARCREREARRLASEQQRAEDAERKKLAEEAAVAREARGETAERACPKGFGDQVKELVSKLNTMTQENRKLRALLAQTAKSGVVGWHPPAPPRAEPMRDTRQAHPSSKSTRRDGDDGDAAATADPADTSDTRDIVALHDEDDVQTETKILRLTRENSDLSHRCTELILDIARRDERVDDLERMVVSLQHVTDPSAPSVEHQLRSDLADVRAKLVVMERRAMALDDELHRLRQQ